MFTIRHGSGRNYGIAGPFETISAAFAWLDNAQTGRYSVRSDNQSLTSEIRMQLATRNFTRFEKVGVCGFEARRPKAVR